MTHRHQIRGDIIQEFTARSANDMSRRLDLIAKRDQKLRSLNKEFGYSEPDGTYGIGCRSHIDSVYKRRYDEIEDEFRKPYDEVSESLDAWRKAVGMTIYEYLFLDNIGSSHLQEIADACMSRNDWAIDPVALNARLLIQDWAKGHNIGEIRKLLNLEVANQHYAHSRCRKFLGIRPWDISSQLAIFSYGREWKSALHKSLNSRSAT